AGAARAAGERGLGPRPPGPDPPLPEGSCAPTRAAPSRRGPPLRHHAPPRASVPPDAGDQPHGDSGSRRQARAPAALAFRFSFGSRVGGPEVDRGGGGPRGGPGRP